MDDKKRYTLGEEIFNSVSHGVGALFGIAALVLMIVYAALYGDGYGIASAIVYGITLILLFTMSTLYHALVPAKPKKIFQIFDHACIYLLIAGTYTPYTLITLRNEGALGWTLFGVIWGFAVIGILFSVLGSKKYKLLTTLCYLFMGWGIIAAIKPLVANISLGGLYLLIAGGILYTLGAVFYVIKKIHYFHSVWHLFVLAASICHFLSVLFFVLPLR